MAKNKDIKSNYDRWTNTSIKVISKPPKKTVKRGK